MKKIEIYLFTIITLTGLCEKIFAQVPPSKDQNWQLVSSLSDSFNVSPLDVTKWHALDCLAHDCCVWGGSSAFSPDNVSVSGGTLNLKCDGPSAGWFCFIYPGQVGYKTGGITSLNDSYTYGYIEVSTQLPGFVDGNGIGHADKFWPALWTYHQTFVGDIAIDHDEIDLMDQCCSNYHDAKTTGSGYYDHLENGKPAGAPNQAHISPTFLCNGYNKFSVEWNTDRVLFYFNDTPYYVIYKSVDMDPMKAVMDLQLDQTHDFYPSSPFPQYMKLDYFYYYQLNKDCNTDAFINNNVDLNTFIYAVKRNITFGNGSNLIYLNPGDSKTFRATNSITINGDFTVPLGSELNLIPTPCN